MSEMKRKSTGLHNGDFPPSLTAKVPKLKPQQRVTERVHEEASRERERKMGDNSESRLQSTSLLELNDEEFPPLMPPPTLKVPKVKPQQRVPKRVHQEAPRELERKSGDSSESRLQSEESLDQNEKSNDPDSSTSTVDVRFYLNLLGNFFAIAERTRNQAQDERNQAQDERNQAQDDLNLSKKKILKCEEDLAFLRKKLALEKENSLRLKGMLDSKKERLVRQETELAAGRSQVHDLKSRLHAAEVKIEDQSAKLLCQICLERPRNAVCLPCLHLSFCYMCLEQHMKNSRTCPICRVLTKSVLECYE